MNLVFEVIGDKNNMEINSIKEKVDFSIPISYLNFIITYGFGILSTNIEYLNIIAPDKDFFIHNFIEDIDLWDWKSEVQKNKITNSLLIAHTFDGQHVYCTHTSFLILPRFGEPIELYDFEEVIKYYMTIYNMKKNIKYTRH